MVAICVTVALAAYSVPVLVSALAAALAPAPQLLLLPLLHPVPSPPLHPAARQLWRGAAGGDPLLSVIS